MRTGVAHYIGCPGSGKTTLALEHLGELERETGWPSLVIDSGGVDQLAGVPHVSTVSAALHRVWGAPRRSAAIVPSSREDLAKLVRACLRPGQVNLLVDESHYWIDARRDSTGLLELMRKHRHARANVLCTTQHLTGDVSQAALSCAPVLYVFRCTSSAVLDKLERDYELSAAEIRTLDRGRYLRVASGF